MEQEDTVFVPCDCQSGDLRIICIEIDPAHVAPPFISLQGQVPYIHPVTKDADGMIVWLTIHDRSVTVKSSHGHLFSNNDILIVGSRKNEYLVPMGGIVESLLDGCIVSLSVVIHREYSPFHEFRDLGYQYHEGSNANQGDCEVNLSVHDSGWIGLAYIRESGNSQRGPNCPPIFSQTCILFRVKNI